MAEYCVYKVPYMTIVVSTYLNHLIRNCLGEISVLKSMYWRQDLLYVAALGDWAKTYNAVALIFEDKQREDALKYSKAKWNRMVPK